ncbi:caspase family protein [Desulfococcaceae bacterium HSG7]|nr:caspase family protein [Desulfococcaceae bacterium HSG7]
MSHHKLNLTKTLASVMFAGVIIVLTISGWPANVSYAAENAPAAGKYALLIGIDKYEGKPFKPLKGTHNDVALIKELLIRRFLMPKENITVLLDENATHNGIRKEFQRLAAKLKKGDMAYIHYSGHGSYTCDLNDDEDPAWGKDSTWVCYGVRKREKTEKSDCTAVKEALRKKPSVASRATDPQKLNDYDILDDEINSWLAALEQKTDQIIFVSDSCHSGTVMRGTLHDRSLPIDIRPHPLGTAFPGEMSPGGLRVSACRDDEMTIEITKYGKTYGIFTWFWAQALEEARPGETWGDLHKRASARLHIERARQHPQLEGNHDRLVFGGIFKNHPHTMTVLHESSDGKTAIVDVGSLLGLTVGSVLRKYTPGSDTDNPTTLKITSTKPLRSTGQVAGALKVGDQMMVDSLQYNTDPLKVLIRADLAEDRGLKVALAAKVGQLPGFTIENDQTGSAFVLQILRPRRDAQNNYVFKNKHDSLPGSFPALPPECWILTPDEKLYPQELKIKLDNKDKGIRQIAENLNRIVRMQRILTLNTPPKQKKPIAMQITVWREAADNFKGETIEIESKCKKYRKVKTVAGDDNKTHPAQKGDLLTFNISNRSDQVYYLYLVNITSGGAVMPFFPKKLESIEQGRIGAETVCEYTKFRHLTLTEPVEYIRLIATHKPIDIYILEQEGFKRRAAMGALNPLERLLSARAGFIRSRSQTVSAASWTTLLNSFSVDQ